MANPLFRKKSLTGLLAEAADPLDDSTTLKRSLGRWALIALGVGAIIGAGLFVRTAAAAANNAGPAVTYGFIIAGIGCAFAGLCYAEFASMVPISGSAYTYSYTTMGELVAWIIGWDLVLEYALGAATVGIAWSEYLNKLLGYFGTEIPYQWCHSPFNSMTAADGSVVHGIINLPAIFIITALTWLLIRGMKGSSFVNSLIVITKVAIVILFIVFGWGFINPENHVPFIPEATKYVDDQGVTHNFGGLLGILGAAGVVFFAFIGFDAVSTAAQEAKNPKKDMPWGILGSLVICTILYILFSYVLTGVASTEDFRTNGKEASVTYAIQTYMEGYSWLGKLVTVAILAGFSSVILVMLMGQSRVFYSMSRDGLVPKIFSDIHKKHRTPYKSNILFCVFVGLFAAFIPGDIVGDMTSIGTLFAFILVCAGVWMLRVKNPEIPRQFKTPFVPLVPILGIIVCTAMIYGLGWPNWLRLGIWMLIGVVIYFAYGRHHSKLNQKDATES
ncbi:MAG: amino acid permease [Chitinophagales bacterium]|nr:amino acid permease [Bacteroidota bacterium]MBP8915377.1 amino acid permease [Chitinophagales bacterium]MBP9220828.1 amino acid permease [Chitinophagales bacterium]MBP9794530.1 amino acid permease [Chitinophagales bacterium]